MGKAKRGARPETARFRADEKIADALERDPRVAGVLSAFGLLCTDCVVKDYETLEEGCRPLGVAVEDVLVKLNALPQA